MRIGPTHATRVSDAAAADVVHLLTELVDNALAYSSPTTTVDAAHLDDRRRRPGRRGHRRRASASRHEPADAGSTTTLASGRRRHPRDRAPDGPVRGQPSRAAPRRHHHAAGQRRRGYDGRGPAAQGDPAGPHGLGCDAPVDGCTARAGRHTGADARTAPAVARHRRPGRGGRARPTRRSRSSSTAPSRRPACRRARRVRRARPPRPRGRDAAANVVPVLPAGLPQRGVPPESAAPALDTFVSPPDLRVVPPIEGKPADAPPAPVVPLALVASNALDADVDGLRGRRRHADLQGAAARRGSAPTALTRRGGPPRSRPAGTKADEVLEAPAEVATSGSGLPVRRPGTRARARRCRADPDPRGPRPRGHPRAARRPRRRRLPRTPRRRHRPDRTQQPEASPA